MWVSFGVVQLKARSDAHGEVALFAYVCSGLAATPFLLTAHRAVFLSFVPREVALSKP